MPRIPALTARKVIRALRKVGFVKDRQKGSHLVLIHLQTGARTVVPIHAGKIIKRRLLYAIVDDAKLSVDEFLKLL